MEQGGGGGGKTGSQAHIERNPALDGIRAVAILAVVLFHARLPWAQGGFTGVDVFFVLSGYLITRLLLREHEQTGGISLLDFYARRARRLLPALAVTLVIVLALGWLQLSSPRDRARLAESAVAAALFSANLLFRYRADDYFDEGGNDLLTHTWSLAVEEQFYLAWPVLLYAVLRWRRKLVPVAIAAAAVTSFYIAVRYSLDSVSAFYLSITRAWELGLGALLAWAHESNRLGAVKPAVGWLGLGLIVVAAGALDETAVLFPWELFLPTVGCACLIAATYQQTSLLGDVLATRPLRWIGERSYGWYLFHFPAMVLASALDPGAKDSRILAAFVALALAHASFTWLEQPIRLRRWRIAQTTPRTLRAAGVTLVLLVAAAASLRVWAARHEMREPAAGNTLNERCPELMKPKVRIGASCMLGSDRETAPLVLLWGDSHAQAMTPLLDEVGRHADVRVLAVWQPGCAPLLAYSSPLNWQQSACLQSNHAVYGALARSRHDIDGVVLIARWSWIFGNAPRDTSLRPEFERFLRRGDTLRIAQQAGDALQTTVRELRRLNLRVLLVAQPPEWSFDPRRCREESRDCTEPLRDIEAHQAASAARLRAAARADSGVQLLEVNRYFCREDECSPVRDREIAFRDPTHVSSTGAAMLASETECAFAWVAGRRDAATCPVLTRLPER